MWKCPKIDRYLIASTILAIALIVSGIWIYEWWYRTGMTMHPIVYLTGGSLFTAGVVSLAADWFGL
jgi:hypothetical protein